MKDIRVNSSKIEVQFEDGWRTPTEEDLKSNMTGEEVTAYSKAVIREVEGSGWTRDRYVLP